MKEIADYLDVFLESVGRDEDLRGVSRYSLYKVMLYRTNLYTHSHRVAALVRAMNPVAVSVFGAKYDPRKAELIAYVHDDAELVFGDVQAGNKSKMTAEQLQQVKEAEERAIQEIARRFPTNIDRYSYQQLLIEAADYSSLEAQVVCYADKYDALGEALHEVFAGNHHFTTNVVNEYGRIPTPPEYYAGYFGAYAGKFPEMRPLLGKPFAMFEPIPDRDYSLIVREGKPHVAGSSAKSTDDLHYDTWRQIVWEGTNDEVRRDLYVQKEFLEDQPSRAMYNTSPST
jgi:5'-deoxynucleotidase YfbR-like HD superfamily hydrolase